MEIKPIKLVKGQGLAKLVTDSNCESLQLNFLSNHSNQLYSRLQVITYFTLSPWYSDIVYVLQNLQASPRLSKTRARSMKLNATKFCIMNQYLYWKDPRGILLNYLLEIEARQTMKEFHRGICGEDNSWKVIAN